MHIIANRRRVLQLIFLALLSVLGISFYLEFFQNLAPCPLCNYQRGFFAAAALVAGVGGYLFQRPPQLFFAALLVLFAMNATIAGYQVALEYGWIRESIFCKPSSDLLNARSINELRHLLIAEGFRDCSKPQRLFAGLSIAFYSLILSTGLTVVSALFVRNRKSA